VKNIVAVVASLDNEVLIVGIIVSAGVSMGVFLLLAILFWRSRDA
jgi:hypothetical protein